MERLGTDPKLRELERVVRVTLATIAKVAKNIRRVFITSFHHPNILLSLHFSL